MGVHSSSKSHKGEISKRGSSQDTSDDKSKTSRSSSKVTSTSDPSSDSSNSESEKDKDSEEEAREQQSLHSIGNLMNALKNKKKVNEKKKSRKKKSKKEKGSKSKKKKSKEIEIDSDSSKKTKKHKKNKRKNIEKTFIISDETEEDEQPIQTINKLKVEPPRSVKHKSSSKNTEDKKKKHSKRKHKSAASSSSSITSESDDSTDSDSDKEISKSRFKNIDIQKLKDDIEDVGGTSSIGEKKISISLKDNFSIRINKKNALGIEEEPTKKMSGLPVSDKEPEENKYTYYNPYEKKRISHLTPQEEKTKLFESEKKSVSSLYERTSLVLAAVNEGKGKDESLKSLDKNKNIPTIPLPDEKLVREEAIRSNVIKDLIEENDIIKDALLQGSESQRDVIKDAIKDVIGNNTEKGLIRVRSDIVKDTVIGMNDVKKSQTTDKIKSIPTIPLPADKPKKKQESDDEIEEVWRKAVPGSSRRRSGEIKLNLLSDKARNNDKSKDVIEMKDDVIGLQIHKKKEEPLDLLNRIKKLSSDEDKNKDKNEIKKIYESNQDKNIHKSENKEKEKLQSHKDPSCESDIKQIKVLKGTP